jgi:hypothetical protein
VELVPERVPGPRTVSAQLGTDEHHLVVRLKDGEPGDPALEPAPAKFSPTSTDGPEAQLHHRLEGEQHRRRPDEPPGNARQAG